MFGLSREWMCTKENAILLGKMMINHQILEDPIVTQTHMLEWKCEKNLVHPGHALVETPALRVYHGPFSCSFHSNK